MLPNRSLINEQLAQPQNFTELLSLLIPQEVDENGEKSKVILWKRKEFYKQNHIRSLILHALQMIERLPRFHKDEIPVILRIVCLYQEIQEYEAGYELMKNQGLERFVYTALTHSSWDIITELTAWNYIVLKSKTVGLQDQDYDIWERIKYKFNSWKNYESFFSSKEVITFVLLFVPKEKSALNEHIMEAVPICNSYIDYIIHYDLLSFYETRIEQWQRCGVDNRAVICHRIILAQLSDIFSIANYDSPFDFISECRELMLYADYEFLCSYHDIVAAFLSYIPFFNLIQVPRQVTYFEQLLKICKADEKKEEFMRRFVFSQFGHNFLSFIAPFIRNKCYGTIHDMLFYWCTEEERLRLEKIYNLQKLYEMYACG
ncbi:DUF3965 domain-containing protein [Ectobacillus antri]|jgi:hypothetical protein|uniref:DUF3965 domain-containing protein n=1 Tax=Ectobacillus antri TaxID=2486280 RepID=A0ABT6HA41_9BACI|nr:DUF3965 domain-containing protein [Ectobacillus antri]MDG4658180.1 DUF3965 domain-containing protein [Ectobacillus antri]MDG5755226.1 DUF3965 domain-containing protein [Ectobacillus antri]